MTPTTDNLGIEREVPLAPHTTFGIGGPAKLFARPQSSKELVETVCWAEDAGEPWFLLGLGANILVGDRGFDGLVIKNEARGAEFDGELLTAESGAVVGELILRCAEHELSGIEHFVGIPSTLGGALWQNLHFLAPDRQSTLYIGDIVESATLLSGGEMIEVDHDWFNFGYDYSTLHETRDVVLSATLRLEHSARAAIEQVMADNLGWRGRSHPPEAHKNSAGSIFRKIEGVGAGRLIDAAGLKGARVGGAQVSAHHANYIVNVGGATAADVRELIELVQQRVEADSGYSLTPEIGLIGDF
jgi:UDP-N-acetylmuramate dehydrogenase